MNLTSIFRYVMLALAAAELVLLAKLSNTQVSTDTVTFALGVIVLALTLAGLIASFVMNGSNPALLAAIHETLDLTVAPTSDGEAIRALKQTNDEHCAAATNLKVLPTAGFATLWGGRRSAIRHVTGLVDLIRVPVNDDTIAKAKAAQLQVELDLIKAAYARLDVTAKQAMDAQLTGMGFTIDSLKDLAMRNYAANQAVIAERVIEGSVINTLATVKAAKTSDQLLAENLTLKTRIDRLLAIIKKAAFLLNPDFKDTAEFVDQNRDIPQFVEGVLDALALPNGPERKPRPQQQQRRQRQSQNNQPNTTP